MPEYLLYGVRVRANRSLPGLTPAPEAGARDLELVLAGSRTKLVPFTDADWVPLSTIPQFEGAIFQAWKTSGEDRPAYRLRYSYLGEHAEFTLAPAGSTLWVTWSSGAPLQDVMSVLVGQVMGCVLRLRGILCLHAAVLAQDEAAILLLGHRGAGKSTTATALRQAGCRVVADDVAALVPRDGQFYVHAGPPRMRLRPAAAAHFTGDTGTLPSVWIGDERPEKWHLDVANDQDQFTAKALPVVAAYVLAPRDPSRTTPAVNPLRGAVSLMSLLEHTYVDFIAESPGRASDFAALGPLAAVVPLRRVERPDGLDALPAICGAILDDVSTIMASFHE